MNPLDSLRPTGRKQSRIYRSNGRVNFLVDKKNDFSEQSAPRQTAGEFARPELKKHTFIKIFLIAILIVLVTGAMYLSESLFTPAGGGLAGLNKFNPFSRLAHLVTSGDKRVAGEFQDRVNLLMLGIGGEGHDGPYLTDTIIVASIKPSTGEVGLVSIPRDMVVKLRDGNWYKINQVYSMGKTQKLDKGADYITQAVEDTLKIDIHYYGLITFKGFVEFIDEIGGISVNVPVGFIDQQYPTDVEGETFTASFEAGQQTMNGQTALIYARSRHGNNFEGSDFARSRRQQLIIQAIKEKVFKFSTLLSPQKMTAIFDLLGGSVETNMSIWQAIKIADMVKETNDSMIYRIVLDDMPDSILEPGFTEESAWILKPKDGSFETLARQFNNIFDVGKIAQEAAKIEILNGTVEGGLAYWTASFLEKLGYNIFAYGNAPSQDYQRTVIYDLSDGEKKQTLKNLKEELKAYAAKPVPDYLTEKYRSATASSTDNLLEESPDIIAVLGLDHASWFKLPELEETSATSTEELATSTEEIIEE